MHVGFSSIFANDQGGLSDLQTYRRDLRLFDLAEPLGFDSVWTVEHHFSGYSMSPSPLVFLSYMAGRTSRIKIGSQVVVLNWHDPLRVAEEVALLDNLSGGRFILGIGRGLSRREYDGYRVDLDSSRDRFLEYAELVLRGLETGVCEMDGNFVKQPARAVRPRPVRSFADRTYVASMSSDAMEMLAHLGVGLKIVVQKPWPSVIADVEAYANVFREVHGSEPPPPIVTSPVFMDRDAGRAKEIGERALVEYFRSVVDHYEFDKPYGGPGDTYKKMAENIGKYGYEAMGKQYASLCPHGTPDEVFASIVEMREKVGIGGFIAQFQFGSIDAADAELSMRLFAQQVLPRLHALDGGIAIDDASDVTEPAEDEVAVAVG
jgi:alkanesulfonate monooxygenase SsuD/methylene tetrahydromethanopterin reductase-like flavin-dependent oxidoreductase (luciferase family)